MLDMKKMSNLYYDEIYENISTLLYLVSRHTCRHYIIIVLTIIVIIFLMFNENIKIILIYLYQHYIFLTWEISIK